MNHAPTPRRVLTLALLAPLALLGCEEEGIRSYEAPKDAADSLQLPATTVPGLPTSAPGSDPADGDWELPEGWTASSEQRPMRLATFIAPNPNDAEDPLEVALSVFPQDVGGALANVNRWRGQLGLDPVSAAQLPDVTAPLTEGDDSSGTLVEIEGEAQHQDLGEVPVAMIVAMVPDPAADRTWFVKAVGLPDQVATQRDAFIQFARTLPPDLPAPAPGNTPGDAPAAAGGMGTASATSGGGGGGHDHSSTHWDTPAHWTAEPNPSSMLEAAYLAPLAPGSDGSGGEARITLMTLPGDGGGALPNINRWRAQVGLPELQTLAEQPVQRLAVGGQPAVVIDLLGTPPGADEPLRTIVALVARPQETWFIKMTGDEAAVQREAPHFQNLLQTIHFH
jgi:hypothetical protein